VDPLIITPAQAPAQGADDKNKTPSTGQTTPAAGSQQTQTSQQQPAGQQQQVSKGDALLATATAEFASTGTMSEATMKALQDGLGLSKASIEKIVAQMAPKAQPQADPKAAKALTDIQQRIAAIEGEKHRQTVFAAVGGEAQYNQLKQWAAGALSPTDIAAFNQAVESGDVALASFAAKSLQNMFNAAFGREGAFVAPGAGPAANDVYRSWDELSADLNSVEYKRDKGGKKAAVREKLVRSRRAGSLQSLGYIKR